MLVETVTEDPQRATPAPAMAVASWIRIGDHLDLPATAITFERNGEIYGEGELAEFVYLVVSGAVRTARYLEDGRRQVGAFYLPGDIFGLEAGPIHRFAAEAVVECGVRLVKRATLEKAVAQDVRAARQLWALTSLHLAQAEDQLMLLGRKTALERVSSFLLEMFRRTSSAGVVELPMTRNDIADYLGLTIETVSRTLTQLERTKAISLPSSRQVILRNHSALAMA